LEPGRVEEKTGEGKTWLTRQSTRGWNRAGLKKKQGKEKPG
jgi:hypothetical protein